MSSIDRPVRRAIYLAVLSATEPSPLLPETGDEPPPPPSKTEAPQTPPPAAAPPTSPKTVAVRIDFDGVGQRVLSVNVPAGDYSSLSAGAAGSFYYTEPMVPGAAGPPNLRLQRYQISARAARIPRGCSLLHFSADKKKVLYQAAAGGAQLGHRRDRPTVKTGDGPIKWHSSRCVLIPCRVGADL